MKPFIIILAAAMAVPVAAHAQKNPLRDSLAAAAEVLAYHPDSIDLRLRKAAWNIELGEWQYAKGEYDYVLAREPDNPAALFYRAYCNDRIGRYNFARADYLNLLKVVPGNFEAQLGLALLNQKDRHYTEAFDGINRLVSQFPDSAVAYAARGGIEREREMYELALNDYEEASRLDPGNRDYLLNRIDLLMRLGRKDDAGKIVGRLEAMGMSRVELRKMLEGYSGKK